MRQQFRHTKLSHGDAMPGVVRVLGCDMNPFVQDHLCDGVRHELVALFAAAADSLLPQHLADAFAVHMNEGLDVPIGHVDPAEWAGSPGMGLAKDFALWSRCGFALSHEIDGDGVVYDEARRDRVSAQDLNGRTRVCASCLVHRLACRLSRQPSYFRRAGG